MSDIIDLGVAQEILAKSGAWISYENEKIGQGRESARKYLQENPKIMVKIEKEIIAKLKAQNAPAAKSVS